MCDIGGNMPHLVSELHAQLVGRRGMGYGG
jgi:hypothetical protein